MGTFFTLFLRKLETLCFPYLCVLCFQRSEAQKDLCLNCQASLPGLGLGCKQCSDRLFIGSEEMNMLCGRCLKELPFYNEILPLYAYESPVIQMIHRLKFSKKLLYARLFGELMTEMLFSHYQRKPLPQCIIPVPLHVTRLQERGFNQALEIARPIAKKLGIPLEPFICERVYSTLQQASIPLEQREKNVKHAFAKVGKKSYQSVAIIDDVVTTGFTVNALSQCLKKAGVEEVVVWCCARTLGSADNRPRVD